ncbi:MAG: matrixin family metalloprotease [Nanoarchaeota archaeon]|nr:matrixin family metalloprotease [Nanoarchaeota archaeon]
MSWKAVTSFITFVILASLLVFYFLPIGEIVEFSVSGSDSNNFTIGNSTESQAMQFYSNMRYPERDISYNIEGCPVAKSDEMLRAFDLVESFTILNFHEVEEEEQITVTCDSSTRSEGRAFIAGEGGVTNVTSSGEFNVISKGQVLLLRESKCSNPIVGTHELLHALGFDHSENSNNIMYPTVNCKQNISEDMIEHINWIYSFPSLPDLLFEDASASMQGNYLSTSMTIRNHGLVESPPSKLIINANGKEVKEFDIEKISVGGGRVITLTNVFITKSNIEEIELLIENSLEEMDKNNNRITLKIKNI